MSTVVFDFHCRTAGQGRIRLRRGQPPIDEDLGTAPRITKLMALALKFERLVQERMVEDNADLARHGHVTRARIRQIMGLSQTLEPAEGIDLASDMEGFSFQSRTGGDGFAWHLKLLGILPACPEQSRRCLP